MMLTVQILKLRFKGLHISKCQVSIRNYENECQKLVITTWLYLDIYLVNLNTYFGLVQENYQNLASLCE